jgi:SMC interacting uncharacterized protein involved in chromosome segregation
VARNILQSSTTTSVQVDELTSDSQTLRSRNEELEKLQLESEDVVHGLEANMASLSGAYQDLQHVCELKESELEALRASRERQQATGDAGAASLSELLELRQEMDDLLVCLGQEEQKVEVLSKKLEEHGVDAEALIEHIVAEGSSENGGAPSPRAAVDVGSWLKGSVPGGSSAVPV